MSRKRGKLSTEEEEYIRNNARILPISEIAVNLNRTEDTVREFCVKARLTYTGMSEQSYDDTVLRTKLEERPYWTEVKKHFSGAELETFAITWIRMMRQFREDVLYTEELQIKQWINLDIQINRILEDRQRAICQADRLQKLVDEENAKSIEVRDMDTLMRLETELSMVRNSLGAYTTEHCKLLDKIKDIQKDFKAARSDRVKNAESLKSNFVGFLKALEDEEIRARVGEDAAIMALAKEKAKERLSAYFTYEDGQVDQPFLTPETAKDNEDDN